MTDGAGSAAGSALITPAGPAQLETEVKKSRFLAWADHVANVDQAERFVAGHRRSDANHNCWAWRVGASHRSSDDGEPSGSAGRPILAAIDGRGLDQVAVLVVRYFGGIKLGVGGLVRAYGGSAARCLDLAGSLERFPTGKLSITAPLSCMGRVRAVLQRRQLTAGVETYRGQDFSLTVAGELRQLQAVEVELKEATRGSAQLKVSDTPGSDSA
ncbi:MAG: YigZ family protein [Xanthomonadales bacterium]|nr:YigZ family protein [Xanthomonadales bacterium]